MIQVNVMLAEYCILGNTLIIVSNFTQFWANLGSKNHHKLSKLPLNMSKSLL